MEHRPLVCLYQGPKTPPLMHTVTADVLSMGGHGTAAAMCWVSQPQHADQAQLSNWGLVCLSLLVGAG